MTEIKKDFSIFNIHPCSPVYKIEDLGKTSIFVFKLVQYIANGFKMVCLFIVFLGGGDCLVVLEAFLMGAYSHTYEIHCLKGLFS